MDSAQQTPAQAETKPVSWASLLGPGSVESQTKSSKYSCQVNNEKKEEDLSRPSFRKRNSQKKKKNGHAESSGRQGNKNEGGKDLKNTRHHRHEKSGAVANDKLRGERSSPKSPTNKARTVGPGKMPGTPVKEIKTSWKTPLPPAPANAWGHKGEVLGRLGVADAHGSAETKRAADRQVVEGSNIAEQVDRNGSLGDDQTREDDICAYEIYQSLKIEEDPSDAIGQQQGGSDELSDCSTAVLENVYHVPDAVSDFPTCRVRPRGIKNPGNICFANSVVQALLGSTLFVAKNKIDESRYPVLHSLACLAGEFDIKHEEGDLNDSKHSMNGYNEIKYAVIAKVVRKSFKTRYECDDESSTVEQEDAHEFLHCLLDSIHHELKELEEVLAGKPSDKIAFVEEMYQEDGWLTKSGKRAVKQHVVSTDMQQAKTVVNYLFEGTQSISIASAGCPNSLTLHPFLVVEIPLFNPEITSLSQAIDSLTCTETIVGYRPSGKDYTCDASKSEKFHALPPILILHLMRFQFSGLSEKISKKISFQTELALKSSWLSPGSKDKNARYVLVSTVSHHGQSISSGHYTTNVQQKDGSWLHFDDEHIYSLRDGQILNDTPYLLIYQRIK
eukprot:jgi/Picsp_1/1289/NSC_04770-R1_ubiquitin carboxyl-terminal hydrolase 24